MLENAENRAAKEERTSLFAMWAERTMQLRKDALALEVVLLDRQLKQTQANSNEELNRLRQKLRNGYQAELNVTELAVSAKKVIDAKYDSRLTSTVADCKLPCRPK